MSKTTTKTDASAPKRRRADAERSISSIINAALEALASDPDASMAEIARRCRDGACRRAGRRGDEQRRADEGRAGRGARPRAPRHLARAQRLPHTACDQHEPPLGQGAAPPPPAGDDAVRPTHRARSEE